MTDDGPSVLVTGAERDRVSEIAGSLADSLSVRTHVSGEVEGWPADVEVAVVADGPATDDRARESPPADAARVAVFEEPDEFDRDRLAAYDRVVVEPLVPGDLDSTVTALARRVRYDRRLQECAELAARCGRAQSDGDTVAAEPHELCERITAAKSELDGLVAEFSSDDFRQAFRTLAAD